MSTTNKSRPSLNPEIRQSQVVGAAINLAEEQIFNKTASSQVLTHFLKIGSIQAEYELEKLKNENELLKAKAEAIKAQKDSDDVYQKVLDAMRTYSGNGNDEDYY